jgi:glycerol kinase
LVPAFTGLGAPHWRPAARAAVFGLTRGATAAHLCRAALDAMAYQTWDVCTAMQSDGRAAGLAVDFGPLRVDGGASRNDLLMQFQADLLGLVVDRPVEIETTALGAAGLAGLGCGLWSDPTALAVTRTSARTFSPQLDAAARDAVLAPWRDAVRRLVDA